MTHRGPVSSANRAIVIGAGIGGLSAVMRLGAKGYRMTVLDRVGGRGSSITQNGHRFDLGPTIVTVPQVLEELWAACGRDFRRDVDLSPLDPFFEIRWMIARLLAEADRLYLRSEAGIGVLPRWARMGIWAARLIYAGIGTQVCRNASDSISVSTHTSKAQKLGWMAKAGLWAAGDMIMPRSAEIYAPPLAETAFLVDAASRTAPERNRTKALLDVLADLRTREMALGTDTQGAWLFG